MKHTPSSRTRWWAMTLPEYPDMNRHLRSGQREASVSASSRPVISGMTRSVISRSISPGFSFAICMASFGVDEANTVYPNLSNISVTIDRSADSSSTRRMVSCPCGAGAGLSSLAYSVSNAYRGK